MRPTLRVIIAVLAVATSLAISGGALQHNQIAASLLSDAKALFTKKQPVAIQVQGIFGADVSEYDDDIDWAKLAHEKQFVFIRASHGQHHDVNFAANWQSAKTIGIVRGAYHYVVPTDNFAEQLRYFVKTVRIEKGDLPPVLDLEKPSLWMGMRQADRLKYVLKWANALERIYGVKPIIYMSPSFIDDVLGGAVAADVLKAYPLWIAKYDVASPVIPLPWTSYIVWQYSESGTCAGIRNPPNPCDMDIAPGTLFDLMRYTVQLPGGGDDTQLTAKELDDEGLTPVVAHHYIEHHDSMHGAKVRITRDIAADSEDAVMTASSLNHGKCAT